MMGSDPARNDRLIEALEACRPGTDDVALPELQLEEALASDAHLRELHERLQRTDARLAAAFGEVPVPEDLEQRILARLEDESKRNAGGATHRGGRRWWMAASAVVAVAASLFVAFWLGLPGTQPRDEAGILAAVLQQFAVEAQSERLAGRLVSEEPPPDRFPMSRAVARVPELRWRLVRGLLGRQAVVYDFPAAEGRGASLYVMAAGDSEIARTRPATHPIQSTGGFCASVWKEGDRLYALVVRGDVRDYRRLIYAPSGPLT